MDVPPTPLWQQWLFEDPLPLFGLLVVLIVAGLAVYRQTGKRPALIVSALGVLLGVGIWLLANAVESPVETLEARVHDALNATTPFDPDAFSALLSDQAILTNARGEPLVSRVAFESYIAGRIDQYDVESHDIVSLDIGLVDDNHARGQLALRTHVGNDEFSPYPTEWGLVWTRSPDGEWLLDELRWLRFRGQDPARLGGF